MSIHCSISTPTRGNAARGVHGVTARGSEERPRAGGEAQVEGVEDLYLLEMSLLESTSSTLKRQGERAGACESGEGSACGGQDGHGVDRDGRGVHLNSMVRVCAFGKRGSSSTAERGGDSRKAQL